MTSAKEGRARKVAAILKDFEFNPDGVVAYIESAVNECISHFTGRDSQKSAASSIPRKVEKFLDQPFVQFVEEFNLPKADWAFSDLTKMELGKADTQLVSWSKNRLYSIEKLLPEKYDTVVATIDFLRNFLFYCSTQIPAEMKVLVINDEGNLDVGKGNKFRRKIIAAGEKATRLMERLPEHLQLFSDPDCCELCCELNAAKSKLIEMIEKNPKIEKKIALAIKTGAVLKKKKLSSIYCVAHSDRAAQGRDEKRRLHFYSAMQLITDVGIIHDSTPHTLENLRKYAYWLTYYLGRMSPALKQLPTIISNFHEGPLQIQTIYSADELNEINERRKAYYVDCTEEELKQLKEIELGREKDKLSIDDLTQLNNLSALLETLENESRAKKGWTKKCLNTLSERCIDYVSNEEWRRSLQVEIDAAKTDGIDISF